MYTRLGKKKKKKEKREKKGCFGWGDSPLSTDRHTAFVNLLDRVVFMARLRHHRFNFIFFRSIGFSQIGGLFNR